MMIPLLEAVGIYKRFGPVRALENVGIRVNAGQVVCLLGDNGAGKSTLIKILSGVLAPDAGSVLVNGERVRLRSPRDARAHGIETVFQHLGVVPTMPAYRNFVLGEEPTRGWGPFQRFDKRRAKEIAHDGLDKVGIKLRDSARPVATFSGGERQSLAIARAVYFGSRLLILDEPTSALGVKEAEIVLRYILRAREHGLGIIFVSHNVQHAYAVGDAFVIVNRGRVTETAAKGSINLADLALHMAGGEDFERLSESLHGVSTTKTAS